MDAVDQKIVDLLRGNGRLSREQIAREINLSRPAVHERVKRLEAQGVIRGYTAEVDWNALGKPLTAFIFVHTAGTGCNDTGYAILNLSDSDAVVQECYRVTGEWCLLLKARVASPLALQALLDRIRLVPGVQGTMTSIALSELHEGADSECKYEPSGHVSRPLGEPTFDGRERRGTPAR